MKVAAPSRRSAGLRTLACAIAIVTFVLPGWDDRDMRFWCPDTFHYADLGRQLTRGAGLSTQITYPYIASWMSLTGVPMEPPWPNVARFPLIAAVYAPFFIVLGDTERTVHLVGRLFFALTAGASFLLGARLFGVSAGIISAGVVAGNLMLRLQAAFGLLELPAALCMVLAALLLAAVVPGRPRAESSRWTAVGLGALLGAAFLLRFDLLAMTVGAVVALGVARGLRQCAWTLLGASVLPGLWMARNLYLAGSPFVFLGVDRNMLGGPGRVDLYRGDAYRDMWTVLQEHPEIVVNKVADVLWPFANWQLLFGWLAPAFVLACAVLYWRRHPAAAVATYAIATFLARDVILSATHHEARFYVSYLPLWIVLVVGVAWMPVVAGLSRLRVRSSAVEIALAAGVAVLQLLHAREIDEAAVALAASSRAVAADRQREERPAASKVDVYESIRRRTPRNAVIATSSVEELAWYADRAAIEADVKQLPVLAKQGLRVDGLLYETLLERGVEYALRRRRLERRFVRVLSTGEMTLWLRPGLIAGWVASGDGDGAGAVPTEDEAPPRGTAMPEADTAG